jgi:hypothetical protein
MSRPGQTADTPPDFFDTAGKWLAARYQLTNRDRDRVKTATLLGQPVSDPCLKEAVRGLASAILDNQLRLPGIAFDYAVGAAAGVLGIVLLAIALSSSGQHGHDEELLIVLAVLAFINVPLHCLWQPRRTRRKVSKALRVNSSDG